MASILVEFLLVGNDGPGVELKCIGNMETMNRSLQDFSSPCGFAGENHDRLYKDEGCLIGWPTAITR